MTCGCTAPEAPWTVETAGGRVLSTEFSSGVASHDFAVTDGLDAGPGWFLTAVSCADSGTIAQPYVSVRVENGTRTICTLPKGASGGLSYALPDNWSGRLRIVIDSGDTANDVFLLFSRRRNATTQGC